MAKDKKKGQRQSKVKEQPKTDVNLETQQQDPVADTDTVTKEQEGVNNEEMVVKEKVGTGDDKGEENTNAEVTTDPQPEPKVEIVEPKTETKPVEPVLTSQDTNDVKSVLSSSKSFEDIYDALKDNQRLFYLLDGLNRYLNTVKHGDEHTVASMNYELYKLILGVLNEQEYAKFKLQFDIINKLFIIDSRFSPITLNRFDYYWTYGNESKVAYNVLLEYIDTMCHPGNRNVNKNKISIGRLAEHVPVKHLAKYYNV